MIEGGASGSRLEAALGGPAFAWLRARLRARLAGGRPLTGYLTLTEPTPEQRSATERLFGRLTRGHALRVDLAELESLLRDAGVAATLVDAVVALEGSIEDLRQKRAEREQRWVTVLAEARAGASARSAGWVEAWLADLVATGLLRRLAADQPEVGQGLLASAFATIALLPVRAMPLAELAAAALGNSHALDAGTPIGTLVLRAVAARSGAALPTDADDRRSAWASVGVLVDELSAPVLLLNLRAGLDGTAARALALAADAGEPYRLSSRQLLREQPTFVLPAGGTVFVCENPTVLAAAADRLGPRAKPLICTEGQPKTALRLLMTRLREIGANVAYHGDFDWPGVQIANGMAARFGAVPWRLRKVDYLNAPPGLPLEGAPISASWDPDLADTMRQRGCAVHEEAVLPTLLEDLA